MTRTLAAAALSLLSIIAIPSSGYAVTSESTQTQKTVGLLAVAPELDTVNESLYLFFDTGFAQGQYQGEIGQRRDRLGQIDQGPDGAISETGLNLSFGVYFPVNNHQTMIGPYMSANLSSDDIKTDTGMTYDTSMNTLELAASVQHYFGTNIGSGFFVRGDAGVSYTELKAERTSFCIFCSEEDETIDFGDGKKWEFNGYGDSQSMSTVSPHALIGGGYSWGLGSQLRMQVLLSHAYRPTAIGDIRTTNLALGMLF